MSGQSNLPDPVQLPDKDKLRLLNAHRIGADDPVWKNLEETRWCLHCAKVFTGRAVRVYHDDHFRDGYSLVCGTPKCDGSPLDWDLPGSDFAKGVTAQLENAERRRLSDQPVPEHEPLPPVDDPDWEETGTCGPELSVTPNYRDEAQRLRLRPLFWIESTADAGRASGRGEFLRALYQGAKAGMRHAYTTALGQELMGKAKLAFPARSHAVPADDDPEDPLPEQFRVEVEYGDYEEEPVATVFRSFDAFDDRLYQIAQADATEASLRREILAAITRHLAENGAATEKLDWKIEVDGFGG